MIIIPILSTFALIGGIIFNQVNLIESKMSQHDLDSFKHFCFELLINGLNGGFVGSVVGIWWLYNHEFYPSPWNWLWLGLSFIIALALARNGEQWLHQLIEYLAHR